MGEGGSLGTARHYQRELCLRMICVITTGYWARFYAFRATWWDIDDETPDVALYLIFFI